MPTRVNTPTLRVLSVTKRRPASSGNGQRILKVFHCYRTDVRAPSQKLEIPGSTQAKAF